MSSKYFPIMGVTFFLSLFFLSGCNNEPIRDLSQYPDVMEFLDKNKVYYSLTTSPKRIDKVIYVINTLDLNNVETLFVVAPERFGRDGSEYVIPRTLKSHPKVKLLRPKKDLGPITKLIPAAKLLKDRNENNALLITIDDDTPYMKGLTNEMIYSFVKMGGSVIAGKAAPLSLFSISDETGWMNKEASGSCSTDQKENSLLSSKCDVVEGYQSIGYPVGKVNVKRMLELSDKSFSPICFRADDFVISFVLAEDNIPRTQLSFNEYYQGVKWQFSYGFEEDALHKGAGEGAGKVEVDTNINYENYGKCLANIRSR